MRFNAAEGILGATALVLVVWILWPESQTPKLDQQAAWQQHLKDAELARDAKLERTEGRKSSRPAVQAGKTDDPQDLDPNLQEQSAAVIAPAPVRKRRVLLMPSQLADRHDGYGYRYDDGPAARPSPRGGDFELARPDDLSADEPAAAAERGREHEHEHETSPEDADAVRDEIIAAHAVDQAPADQPSVQDDRRPATMDVAVYSTEAQDANGSQIRSLDDFDTDSAITVPALGAFSPDVFAVESDSAGDVRRRPRDDAPSWLKNAVAASLVDDRPVIAVVIDDLGLNRAGTKALNDLPGPLSLAFLPYAGNIEAQTDAARRAGHELMLHMPMEPFGSDWPGPGALVTSLSHDEFVARLENNLSRFKGYVGVNNHMGSRLTSDRGRMDLVMRELRERDVLFLDSKTSPRSVASDMASRNGVPNTSRDVFLDHVIDLKTIRSQMALVERIARRDGSAVAIGHPHGATIEALRGWLPGLAERGFTLAPISAVVARRVCNHGLLIAAKTCGHYLQAQKPDAPTITAGGG